MRRRFNPSAVASSDGSHIMISHDHRAGTTGRREKSIYAKCGTVKFQVTPMQAAMLAPYQRIERL